MRRFVSAVVGLVKPEICRASTSVTDQGRPELFLIASLFSHGAYTDFLFSRICLIEKTASPPLAKYN